ncbi:Rv1733c family protein [Pseudonocardia sp. CA-107938]|uniref:Rv1733c family protein n=1 Tax=Pseudonocardia sp. CA-107938 TaxID=3240021 RepID=UPI003D8A2349
MADRNPLRRPIDAVEALVGTVLAILGGVAVFVALVIGLTVHGQVGDQARRDTATSRPVTAELVEDTTAVVNPSSVTARPRVTASVRWTGSDGTPQQGEAAVEAGLQAGAAVTVWLDRDGRPTHSPLTASDAVLCGLLAGLGAAVAAAAALVFAWVLMRHVVLAVNCRRWADEWAAVEPHWRKELR